MCRAFQSISSSCCEVTVTVNCLNLCACKLMEATSNCSVCEVHIQGGSNMTGTNCDLFTHNQSRSYLNHLVFAPHSVSLCMSKPLHSRCSSVFTAPCVGTQACTIFWSKNDKHFKPQQAQNVQILKITSLNFTYNFNV